MLHGRRLLKTQVIIAGTLHLHISKWSEESAPSIQPHAELARRPTLQKPLGYAKETHQQQDSQRVVEICQPFCSQCKSCTRIQLRQAVVPWPTWHCPTAAVVQPELSDLPMLRTSFNFFLHTFLKEIMHMTMMTITCRKSAMAYIDDHDQPADESPAMALALGLRI